MCCYYLNHLSSLIFKMCQFGTFLTQKLSLLSLFLFYLKLKLICKIGFLKVKGSKITWKKNPSTATPVRSFKASDIEG